MRCDRCGYAVPQWLWINDDHPIIVEVGPPTISRSDNLHDNTVKVTAETTVAVRMCKDVHSKLSSEGKVEALSRQTGLNLATCLDLLEKGWTYKNDLESPQTWLGPEATMKRD